MLDVSMDEDGDEGVENEGNVNPGEGADGRHLRAFEEDVVPFNSQRDIVTTCAHCGGREISLGGAQAHVRWHRKRQVIHAVWKMHRTPNMTAKKELEDFGGEMELRQISLAGSPLVLSDQVSSKGIEDLVKDGKQICTIKYIDKMKYTFGQEFIGRDTQGEFTFLNRSAKLTSNYFEVRCCKSIFQIRGLEMEEDDEAELGGTVTVSRNGERINDSGADWVDLRMGDVITISEREDDATVTLVKNYVFKGIGLPMKERKRLRKKELIKKPDFYVNTALKNSLVVHNILGFLSVEDLKNCRLVSPLWSEESVKVMRQRVSIPVLQKNCKTSFNYRRQFFDYIYGVKHLKFLNWKLELPTLGEDTSRTEKYLSDIEWFFGDEFEHSIRHVKLRCRLGSPNEEQALKTVLMGLSASVSSLELDLVFTHYSPKGFEGLEMEFSSLRSLVIRCVTREERSIFTILEGPPSIQAFQSWFKYIVPSLGRIEELGLGSDDEKAECNSMALQQISAQPSSLFTNLSEITLLYTTFEAIEALSCLQTGKLKKLHLNTIKLSETQTVNFGVSLYVALSKHSKTLEDMKFTLPFVKDDLKISFPEQFPKLTRLSLSIPTFTPPKSVKLVFGRDSNAKYSKHFPALDYLHIWPIYGMETHNSGTPWSKVQPVFEAFFPTDIEQVCTTLMKLDIPVELDGDYHPCLSNVPNLFPNATLVSTNANTTLEESFTHARLKWIENNDCAKRRFTKKTMTPITLRNEKFNRPAISYDVDVLRRNLKRNNDWGHELDSDSD